MTNQMSNNSVLENLILILPFLSAYHNPNSMLYGLLKQVAHKEIEAMFSSKYAKTEKLGPFGEIIFPYHKMGAIDSLNLFDIDELIIFSFYWINRRRYHRVLDIGANLGLHSIVLNKCGFSVRSFEPDPHHFKILKKNLSLNKCFNVQAFNAAISNTEGSGDFIRVLGNTTGSHLAGSKPNPYGKLERFLVKTESILSHIGWADLIKLDAEGHEKEIILATSHKHWLKTDAFVEIENRDNALLIFKHLKAQNINLFSQKVNWQRVRKFDDMPISYRDGMLFVSKDKQMPWRKS